MKITIAERLKPFSHAPGASCVIPWSSFKVQAFPALLIFEDLTTCQKQEYSLGWKGPVLDFTLELDLEKGVVWVYGKTAEGHRRICIQMTEEGIAIDKKLVVPGAKVGPHALERLSLGMNKALDWEKVTRRHLMAEVFPVWFRLGQMVSQSAGAANLLQECDKTEVTTAYLKFFLTGFEGILAPRLSDTDHQGIVPEGQFSGTPLALLSEGAKSIRSLFFSETAKRWDFLPCLSPEFHAGRFVQLKTEAGDKIDFEWSKKLLKKVIIHSARQREILISVPKPLISCRLRASLKEKGTRHLMEKPLVLAPGQMLFLDCFEK